MAWEIDKSRTKLEFSVRHMMIHTVRGTFSEFETELDIDPDALARSSARARIQARSVSTRDSLRDEYLVSKNFFNPDVFPHIEYESTSVRLSGKKISVSGRLKIRDKEHQLILSGTVKGPSAGFGGGSRHLVFELQGEIEREPYDLVFNGAVETVSIVVGKKVALNLLVDLVEK